MLKKFYLLAFLYVYVISAFLNGCSSGDNSTQDVSLGDGSPIEDIKTSDTLPTDTGNDAGSDIVKVEKYFALTFDDNTVKFFDREKNVGEPFFVYNCKGEVSSIEYISDQNLLVFSDNASKELVFLKDFVELKRIQGSWDYPYSIKYIPQIKLLVVPDKNSNKLHIIDIEKMEYSSLSPMASGGNYPLSICFDNKPITSELLTRLFILNYGSLIVRAYDIFEKEEWALRGEKLPTLAEPQSIACDSENRRLLVINAASNNISAYGLDDLVQIANSPFEAGKNPTFAATHSGASIAYVTNTSEDSLTIFSTKEMKVKGGINFKPQDRPTRVYVNEAENRLYVILAGAKSLIIYNIEDPLIPERLMQISFPSTPKEMVYK